MALGEVSIKPAWEECYAEPATDLLLSQDADMIKLPTESDSEE